MAKSIKQEKYINVVIIYNPFDITDLHKDKLVYKARKKLKTYLKDLPKNTEWKISVNGEIIDLKRDGNYVPKPDDTIVLALVPQGGKVKSILRLVAMAALVAFGGPLGAFTAGVLGVSTAVGTAIAMAVGGLLINFLLTPKPPKIKEQKETQSYGYDGSKNTAEQGISIPVVYGEFRVAGNYTDLYTKQIGDEQYLYARAALSEGEIESVSDVEINEQPINNFKGVEWGFTRGTNTEQVNPNFGRSFTSRAKGIKLTQTPTVHTTVTAVDQVQLNLQFPRGLVDIDQKKGTYRNKTVNFNILYRLAGASSWLPLTTPVWQGVVGTTSPSNTSRLRVSLATNNTGNAWTGAYNFTLEYRLVGAPSWTQWKTEASQTQAYNYEYNDISEIYQFSPAKYYPTFELPVALGQYEVRATGATIVSFEAYVPGNNSTFSVTGSSTKAKRVTFESIVFPTDGIYELSIARTSAESTNEYIIDEVYLTDVVEIEVEPVALINTATGWYKILMSDQISQIPNVTWKVKGRRVQHYDIDGTPTVKQWTDNVAWCALDAIISEEVGRPDFASLIDFPSFYQWADYCSTNSIKFNGVFDEKDTDLWRVLQTMFRVGHALPIRIGTKIGVAIDKPDTPRIMFGPGSIYKDTFQISYLGYTERANQLEVSFFDKNDRNKQKTIRITDPEAERLNEPTRSVAITLFGVDNEQQANKEAWRQLYMNRLLKRTVVFDAPIESIGLGIGDLAYISHDMMNWAESGRLASGSTTTVVNLDKPVTMVSGKNYALLTIHSTYQRGSATVASKTGNKVTLSSVTGTFNLSNAKRLVQGSIDREIINYSGPSPVILTIDGTNDFIVGQPVQIWDTDVIEERDVILNVGSFSTVTVSSAFSQAPSQYNNWMFGEKVDYKKPYRLRSISGSNYEKRKLTFMEYNEGVYAAPGRIIPGPAAYPTKIINQVYNLNLTYNTNETLYQSASLIASWKSDNIVNYSGADIYISKNDSEFYFLKTVRNVNEAEIEANRNDKIKAKVVSFDNFGNRANINFAPIVEQVIVVNGGSVTGALSVVLDNPYHVVNTDAAGNNGVYTSAGGKLLVYFNGVNVLADATITVSSYQGGLNSGNFSIDTSTNFTRGNYSITGCSSDSGSAEITVSYEGLTTTVKYKIFKNKETAVKKLSLIADKTVIVFDYNNLAETSQVLLTPSVENIVGNLVWSAVDDTGATVSLTNGVGVTKILPTSALSNKKFVTITLTSDNALENYLIDKITVVKNKSGFDFANDIFGGTKPDPNATRNVSQGIHSTSNTYVRGDIVRTSDGTASYIAKQNVPVGTLLTNTAYWDLFVQGSGGAAGAAGISGILSPQSFLVSTDAFGNGGNYSQAGGQFSWYEGNVNRTTSATFSKVGAGSWYNINSSGVFTISDPGVDQATCQFDGTYNGVTIRLTYSIAKSKQGVGGPQGPTGPSSYTIITQGAVTTSGSSITCATSAGSWGTNGAYSPQSFTNGAYLTFNTPNNYGNDENFMVGLNGDAGGSAGFDTIDHAIQFAYVSGEYRLYLYESGLHTMMNQVGGLGYRLWSAANDYKIIYDGRFINYYENTTLVHKTDVGPGRTYSIDFAAAGKASVSNLAFGPVGSTAKPSFTMVATGSAANLIAIGGDSVRVTAIPGGWDIASVHSVEAYRGGAMMAVTIPPPLPGVFHEFMWALNSDAAASATHGSLDYAFYGRAYVVGGVMEYKIEVRNPGNVAPLRILDWTAAHRLSIVYDGQRVNWLIDNTPVYQLFVGSGLTLALDSAFVSASQFTDILFAPVAVAQGQGFTLVGRGGCIVTANSIERVYGGGWNADAYSLETWRGGAFVSFQPVVSGYYMVGLNSDPTTDQNYTSLDHAWYVANTDSLQIYENGSHVGPILAAVTADDVLAIKDDNENVYYLRNGIVQYTRPSLKTLLFLDSSFFTTGSKIVNLAYGPVGSAGAAGLTVPGLAPLTISCDFAGNPKSGQIPKTAQVKVLSGASDVTEASTYSIATSGCTANVSNSSGSRGLITVTAISADSATATVTATYQGASIQVLLNISKSRDGASGNSAYDDTVTAPTSTSFNLAIPQGGIVEMAVGPGGTIRTSCSMVYRPVTGSLQLIGQIHYRVKGESSWTFLVNANGDNANEFEAGFLGIEGTLAAPSSVAIYEFILVLRKNNSNNFLEFESSSFAVQWS